MATADNVSRIRVNRQSADSPTPIDDIQDVESASLGPIGGNRLEADGIAHSTTSVSQEPSMHGEWANMALLLLLYFLQGIPIGLSSAVPMLIASRGASFASQAVFSIAPWPYSLKLLWAPLVDAVWTNRWGLGHRKSWVVPVQLATGAVMIILSTRMNDLFGAGGPEGGPSTGPGSTGPDVPGLTAAFFILYLLVATQDIAVDAWALTMLRPENVGYASTANGVGQSAGVICAYSVFLALESPGFSDKWVRPVLGWAPTGQGLVTMGGFLATWGAIFIVVTLGLWVGKTETTPAHQAPAPHVGVVAEAGQAQASSRRSRSRSSSRAGSRRSSSHTTSNAITTSTVASGSLRQRSRGAVERGKDEEGEKGRGKLLGEGDDEGERAPLVQMPTNSAGAVLVAAPMLHIDSNAAAGDGAKGTDNDGSPSVWMALIKSYNGFGKLLRLEPILLLALLLVTGKVGWQASDRASSLVMQGRGWPKETLAGVDVITSLIQLPLQAGWLSRLAAGPRPLILYRSLYPARIIGCVACALAVYALPTGTSESGVPTASLIGYFLVSTLYATVASLQFLCVMAFFSRVAAGSPSNAGTVVTLLNTLSNLGSSLPGPPVLAFIGSATVRQCASAAAATAWTSGWPGLWSGSPNGMGSPLHCGTPDTDAACAASGPGYTCVTTVDGYALTVSLGMVYAAVWWWVTGRTVQRLQDADAGAWKPPAMAVSRIPEST